MQSESTLLLSRSEVEQLLSLPECINAVETVFRRQGEGKLAPVKILSIGTPNGGLHVKAASFTDGRNYIIAKLNTNFPRNRSQFGLPTIQGVIALYDEKNGRTLALLDSIDITMKRTAAATAVAAKYLARRESCLATICGCGQQAGPQLGALSRILPLERIFAFDLNENVAKDFVAQFSTEGKIQIELVRDVARAIRQSDVIVTCTPSRKFFVDKGHVRAGTFIAAIGADAEDKQEIDPQLIASAKVVADSLEQSGTIGDAHHAIAEGLIGERDIYAELGEIVAGKKPGRTSDDEIIIFDSTGVAFEDAVAAASVYGKALAVNLGNYFAFAA